MTVYFYQDEEAFCRGVQQLIDDSEEKSMFEHLGVYVSQICYLARVHHVRLDPSYFQIAMALKVMLFIVFVIWFYGIVLEFVILFYEGFTLLLLYL